MWRILVPLDGSDEAASVIPDARRLAGSKGTLILVIDAACRAGRREGEEATFDACRTYLDSVARTLRADGLQVETHVFDLGDPASVIERSATELNADITAIATHARPLEERWKRGSVAWTVLMRSTIPVLLHRSDAPSGAEPSGRRILVPLDGSELAESALPLAQSFALRWRAPIWLIQVVDDQSQVGALRQAEAYLAKIAEGLSGEIHTSAPGGAVQDTLANTVLELGITDVVMTSHGKTGLTRAIVGSVADDLIHRVACPIIVIPPLVTLGEAAEEALLLEHEREVDTLARPR